MLCQSQLWKYQSTCQALSNSSSLNHISVCSSNIQLMLLLWKKATLEFAELDRKSFSGSLSK